MRKLILSGGAVIGWLAVGLQFYLILLNRVESTTETIIRFFSYFTILTNILVATCFTVLAINANSAIGLFFARAKTLTSITVYIVVVGVVYNSVLRFLWTPQGLQRIVDELLHSFIPILFLLYWIAFVPKGGLQWRDVLSWLLYPLFYVIVILIRGKSSGFYPYPFIDVVSLGYGKVIINCMGLFVFFLFLSLTVVAFAKYTGKSKVL